MLTLTVARHRAAKRPKGQAGPQPLPIRPRLLHGGPSPREPTIYRCLTTALLRLLAIVPPAQAAAGLPRARTAPDGLIADGTHRALLAKWHLAGNAIEEATVNAGR